MKNLSIKKLTLAAAVLTLTAQPLAAGLWDEGFKLIKKNPVSTVLFVAGVSFASYQLVRINKLFTLENKFDELNIALNEMETTVTEIVKKDNSEEIAVCYAYSFCQQLKKSTPALSWKPQDFYGKSLEEIDTAYNKIDLEISYLDNLRTNKEKKRSIVDTINKNSQTILEQKVATFIKNHDKKDDNKPLTGLFIK